MIAMLFYEPFEGQIFGPETQNMADHQYAVVSTGGRHHVLAIIRCKGHRLLAENMFSRAQSFDRDVSVKIRR